MRNLPLFAPECGAAPLRSLPLFAPECADPRVAGLRQKQWRLSEAMVAVRSNGGCQTQWRLSEAMEAARSNGGCQKNRLGINFER